VANRRVVALRGRRRAGYGPIDVARAMLAAMSRISLGACGACVALAFRRPPRYSPTRRERQALAAGALSRVRCGDVELAVWQWGDGPRVLLAHGWGSHAGRLTHFIPELLAAGFGVSAFDAPAHGTSGGSFATLPDFINAFEVVARLVSPVAVLGHSMGAAACALGLRSGVLVRAAVLLAPPADPENYTRRYARRLRLSEGAIQHMHRCLEKQYGTRLADLRLVDLDPGVPTLVVHDRGDVRVPAREGVEIARSWAGSRVWLTRGLGHHRILRDSAVIRRSARFLSDVIFGAPVASARKAS
jgi:pimeloyl-ACP methyl ester carboxylesterase